MLDTFIGPGWVPVAVLGMGETTATLREVEGLVRAKLYNLNEDLIAEKLNALGLMWSWYYLLISFMLASISQSNRIRSLRFSAFLTVTNQSLNSFLNFLYSISNA